MSTLVKEYNSIGEFIKAVDEIIANYRKALGELLRRLEEIRLKAEQEKHVRAILSKLGLTDVSKANEVDLKGIKLVYNPTLLQEQAHLETLAEAINNKITMLSAIKKELEVFGGADVRVKTVVLFVDDIPKTIMLKTD